MRTLLFSLFCLFSLFDVSAQELNIKSFELDPTDLTARRVRQTDAEGNTLDLVLIKVAFVEPDVKFSGNVVKQIAKKGEYWVYLPEYAKSLTISTNSGTNFVFQFPESELPLQKLSTYRLVVEIPNKKFSVEEAKEAVKGAEKMSFKTYTAHKETKGFINIEVDVSVQYPIGNSFADNVTRESINESLGGIYNGDLMDGNALVTFYANHTLETAKEDDDELDEIDDDELDEIDDEVLDDEPDMMYDVEREWAYQDSIYIVYESPKLLTIGHYNSEFTGGAHALEGKTFYTIRKEDGRKFDKGMLKNVDTRAFKRLLFDGLKPYFHVRTDQDLYEHLQLTDNQGNESYSFEDLDLPTESCMYVTSKHIVFVYDRYEIASWADGMPESRIPFEKMRPYLTESFFKCLE